MISLWGAVSVIKHPEIFEGKNCLQTQITLLKIAPGMTLMSDGVKWCKKQSLFESLYYRRTMDAAIIVIYMIACQQVHIFVTGNECPHSWREECLSSDSDKIGYPLWMEGEALKGELYSQFLSLPLEALPREFCDCYKPAWLLRGFTGPCWLWEWKEDMRFSIWLSGFGCEILVEHREMRQASLHTYLLRGREIQPGRTKKSFLTRTTAAWA